MSDKKTSNSVKMSRDKREVFRGSSETGYHVLCEFKPVKRVKKCQRCQEMDDRETKRKGEIREVSQNSVTRGLQRDRGRATFLCGFKPVKSVK
jgi:hypothetical protein